jgi:hypothetical protein
MTDSLKENDRIENYKANVVRRLHLTVLSSNLARDSRRNDTTDTPSRNTPTENSTSFR